MTETNEKPEEKQEKVEEKASEKKEVQGQPVIPEKKAKPIELKICSTCKKDSTNEEGTVDFPCPACGQAIIVRCPHCRSIAAPYTCPKCGFIGPN